MANGGRQIPNGIGEDPTQDLLANLLVEQFLARQAATQQQPDATRVSQEPRAPQSDAENFIMNLIQGADPSMGVFSGLAGLTPDDPDFKTQILIGLLTGGGLGSLLRAGGRGLRTAGGAVKRKLVDMADFMVDADIIDIAQKAAPNTTRMLRRGVEPLDVEAGSLLREVQADRVTREGILSLNPSQQAVQRRQLLQEIADAELDRFSPGGRPFQRFEEAKKNLVDFDAVIGRGGSSDEALGSLLDQISKTEPRDIEGIRQQIFKDLVRAEERGGGFVEADRMRKSVLEQIEELAQRRGAPQGLSPKQKSEGLEFFNKLLEDTRQSPLSRADFNVSGSVDDALSRLRTGVRDLQETDRIDEIVRRSLEDLFGN